MNKEEIEKAKIGLWNIRVDCLKIMQCGLSDRQDKEECLKEIDVIDNIFKYIKELEQKESILDKVTDKLKEDINRFDKVIKDRRIWGEQKVDFKKYKNYAINLLNIIEGEKK